MRKLTVITKPFIRYSALVQFSRSDILIPNDAQSQDGEEEALAAVPIEVTHGSVNKVHPIVAGSCCWDEAEEVD